MSTVPGGSLGGGELAVGMAAASNEWLANTLLLIHSLVDGNGRPLSRTAKDRLEYTAMRASKLPGKGATVRGASNDDGDVDLEVTVREELSRAALKSAILKKPVCGSHRERRNAAQHRATDGTRLGGRPQAATAAATSAV